MDVSAYAGHVQSLGFGKKLPQATYVLAPDERDLPRELADVVARLRGDLGLGADFNVMKFSHDGGVSFLHYPEFRERPHPELAESVRVSLVTGKVSRLRYGADGNPPILHRKELLVSPGDPDAVAWGRLTEQEESAGLYDQPEGCRTGATISSRLRPGNRSSRSACRSPFIGTGRHFFGADSRSRFGSLSTPGSSSRE
jgi:hypothetical protein